MNTHQSSKICQLSCTIAEKTSIYSDYLIAHGHPDPSFSIDTPPKIDLPAHIAEIRDGILEANEELQALILGPVGHLQRQTLDVSPLRDDHVKKKAQKKLIASQHTNLIGLQAVYRFRLAESFPVGSEASYEQIAQACGLGEPQVRRIMRYTMTKHLFAESRPGFVVHTAASQVLASSSSMRDWVGMVCEEMWPSASRTVDAMAKWPGSQEPCHTVSTTPMRTVGSQGHSVDSALSRRVLRLRIILLSKRLLQSWLSIPCVRRALRML